MNIFQNRPTSEAELTSVLRTAYGYAEKGQYEEAFRICEWLMQDSSSFIAGLRERASVKSHMNDLDGAIEDLRHLISMNSDEPSDYHQLGMLLLQLGHAREAILYFSKAIELEEAADVRYYTNSSLLHRADAELRIGNWENAKLDCQRLPTGYKAYLYGKGMRTREQIESEAHPSS